MQDIDQIRLELTSSLRPVGILWHQVAQETLLAHGVSTSCGSALLFIGRLGEGISQGALAEELGITAVSMVHIVDQLSEAGLVRRQRASYDRRVKTLWLTKVGKEFSLKIEKQLMQLRARVLAPISQSDLAATLRVFHALGQAAQFHPTRNEIMENNDACDAK